jgi:hypothetical protein
MAGAPWKSGTVSRGALARLGLKDSFAALAEFKRSGGALQGVPAHSLSTRVPGLAHEFFKTFLWASFSG